MPRLCVICREPSDVPMHRFPCHKKFPDRFKVWVNLCKGSLESLSDFEIGKKRVCDKHFTDRDRNRFNRLNILAVPSLHLSGSQATMHLFPNPDKYRVRFNQWVLAIGGDIIGLDNKDIYQHRSVCHAHFEEKYCCRFNRLANTAVPTLNLPGPLSVPKFTYEERRPFRTLQVSTFATSLKAMAPGPVRLEQHDLEMASTSQVSDPEAVSTSQTSVEEEPKRHCVTCLSGDRQLQSLEEGSKMADMFLQLVGEFYIGQELGCLFICWECSAVLRRVLLFQQQAEKASHLLTQITKESLSTLRTHNGTDTPHLTVVENIEENIDCDKDPLEFEQENETVYEEERLNNDEITDDDAEFNCEVDKTVVENQEIAKKTRISKWAQKRALLNKKKKFKIVKLEDLDPRNVIRKIRMNPNEMIDFIRKEKMSDYYTSKPYKCDKCVIGFANEKLLMVHYVKRHNKNMGMYTCDVCKTRLSERRNLIAHCESHFYKYECILCKYSCWTKNAVSWHLAKKHKKIYECVKCRLKFLNRKEFFCHYKDWHECFICDYCGMAFKMKYCIKEHIKKQHAPIHCDTCNKTFSRQNALWLHKKLKHSSTERAYCVECDRLFSSVYAYRWHLSSSVRHRPRKKTSIPCPECDKIFTKNIYMKDHYNLVHLKIFKHRCEECDKNFLRNADLVRHKKKIHDRIPVPKNKICNICGQGFSCNKILTNHLRVHTGERPFQCSRCPARFAQQTALVSHTRNVHKQ